MLKNNWNAIWRRNKGELKTRGEFALFWNAITAVHSYNPIVRDLPFFPMTTSASKNFAKKENIKVFLS